MVPCGTPASLCRLITTLIRKNLELRNSGTDRTTITQPPALQLHSSPVQPGNRHPTGLSLVNDVRFTDFNISDSLKNRLTNAGFVTPTPVQAKAIPPALEGNDILATASTGTGKTLSFLIPMIQRMDATSVPSTRGKRSPIRALILLPTRELAMQVLEAYWKLVPGAKHDAVLVCGGLSENTQFDHLDRGPRLVVATPGRLEDFLRRREINLTPSTCSSSTRSTACSTWASFPPSAASSVPCPRPARRCATRLRSTPISARSSATTSRTPSASRSAPPPSPRTALSFASTP